MDTKLYEKAHEIKTLIDDLNSALEYLSFLGCPYIECGGYTNKMEPISVRLYDEELMKNTIDKLSDLLKKYNKEFKEL